MFKVPKCHWIDGDIMIGSARFCTCGRRRCVDVLLEAAFVIWRWSKPTKRTRILLWSYVLLCVIVISSVILSCPSRFKFFFSPLFSLLVWSSISLEYALAHQACEGAMHAHLGWAGHLIQDPSASNSRYRFTLTKRRCLNKDVDGFLG